MPPKPVILPDGIADLCRRYGIRRLWLFGSVLRDDFRPDSDVDVLVDADESVGLLELGGFQMDMTDLVGRFVHLTTLDSVPPESHGSVFRQARLAYAA